MNYELGELDDHVLAADEDELLQSDDGIFFFRFFRINLKFLFSIFFLLESSPTKLSQQEEALLLDDEELLDCPPNEKSNQTESQKPDENDEEEVCPQPPDSIHSMIGEFHDDLVTTTTPEPPTTSKALNSNEAEATKPEDQESTIGSSRTALKRTSDLAKRSDSEDSISTPIESKKLRVEAPEFVPSKVSGPHDDVGTNEKQSAPPPLVGSISQVSTSSAIEEPMDDDNVSSQKNSSLILDTTTTDSIIGLSITPEDDDLIDHEVPTTDEAENHLPTCSTSQESREEVADDAYEAASSTGMEESDSEFTTSSTTHRKALLALPEFEAEDSDEGNERLNPKHHVERDSGEGKKRKFIIRVSC